MPGMHTKSRLASNSSLAVPVMALSALMIAFFGFAMLTPDVMIPTLFLHQDKLEHFAAFGLMAAPAGLFLPRRWSMVLAGLLIVAAGGVEIVQGLAIPGRQGSFADFVWSAAGVLMSGLASVRLAAATAAEPSMVRAA